jgi:hypothetical protein
VKRRSVLRRTGALAVALGALEAAGLFSFVPVRASASIVPSDISDYLPVPPQDYGSDVQFQAPPVYTVFLTAALERTRRSALQSRSGRSACPGFELS